KDSLPVIHNRWGSVRINDTRSVRGYAAGMCNLFCLSGYRLRSRIVLRNHCFLTRPNPRQSFHATFKKKYHDERIIALQSQYQKLQDRLDRMYIDKLDGTISQDQFERMSESFRKEQGDLLRQIDKYQQANQTYFDEGVRLLELSQNVVLLYERQ